jgi:serine/threonine protein kinase
MRDDAIQPSQTTLSAPPLTSTPEDRSGKSPWRELAIGTLLVDRFELRSLLGRGATGLVFEALDRSSGQTLALKLLQHHDASALYRLKHEFRALTEIAHPNLAAMHELFVDEQQRGFFTMQLVRGRTFLEYVRPHAGDYAEERLRACLVQLTLGIRHLHERGKLHCDLKPSNVLVSDAGELCIVDFGLTQSLNDASGLSKMFEGTPAYAAPEQVDPAQRSYASDWYAVGVMLYEALTGARPWPGNRRELLEEKARHDPPSPSQRTSASVDPALERLCLQLLARDAAVSAGQRVGPDERPARG